MAQPVDFVNHVVIQYEGIEVVDLALQLPTLYHKRRSLGKLQRIKSCLHR